MKKQDTVRYEMFARVRDFGEKHRDSFPESSVGGQAFAEVAAAVTQLGGYAVDKMVTAQEGKRRKAAARQALVERLEAIVRTARVIAVKAPSFDDSFNMPRPRSAAALVTAGRTFIRQAEPLKAQFIAHGLPDAFVTDLTTLVDTFERAIRGREAGKHDQRAANAGIAKAIASGQAAVRALDVIVANQLAHDPVTLAAWDGDRQVASIHRRKTAAVPPTPAPPAPVPVAPVAETSEIPLKVAS